MPTIMLTARFVAGVKPTPGKRVEYFDRQIPGFALRVMPTGMKTWTVLYRNKQARLRRLTIGSAAVLTLVQARERARDELYAAGKGADPASQKRDDRRANTIGDLATDYIEKWARPRKRSWAADDRMLRAYVLPAWRSRAIIEITRTDVRLLVDRLAERGAPIMANRLVSLLSKLFTFALDRDLIQANPAVRIPRPGREQPRDRVLTQDEIRTLWKEWEDLPPEMAAFFKLRLLTAQRGAEVCTMRWQDVDLKSGWWTIPATVAKNKLAHRVPLSQTVLSLLNERRVVADQGRQARIASAKDPPEAMYVLEGARGKRQQAVAAAKFSVSDFRGHDLRRTAASFMASGGIPRLTVAKILNHVERTVTAVYDRHSYDAEKTAALTWWDAKLKTVLEQREAARNDNPQRTRSSRDRRRRRGEQSPNV